MPRRKTAHETDEGRSFVTFALTARSNAIINRWLDEQGGSKTRFIQRLLEFFAAAPPSVQHLLASSVPADLRAEVARRASEYFAFLAEGPQETDLLVRLASAAKLSTEQQKQVAKVLKEAKTPVQESKRRTA